MFQKHEYPHRGTQRYRRMRRGHTTKNDFCCGYEFNQWLIERGRFFKRRDTLKGYSMGDID